MNIIDIILAIIMIACFILGVTLIVKAGLNELQWKDSR